MLTTQYVHGAVNWLDLGSPDIPTTVAHYTALLGWSFQSMGGDDGFGMFQFDGKNVAGLGPLTEQGARSAWMPYFMASDADATVKAVEQAGGTVRTPAFDAMDAGRLAQLTDPAGAEFAIWQQGTMKGFDLVTQAGSLGWAELHVANPAAIRPFYQSVFGWRFEDMPMGDMTYTVISPAEGDDNSSMAGVVELQPGDRPHWLPYFEVTDCDAAVAISQANGGTVISPAMSVPTVGRFAFLADPHGARFAVITSES